ncbi:mechanosensitive ion channel domain-containing protein [Noviherbaspirillum sp. Root189]|uniref:mechanosensitive ion channel domain-containing protein n=1 Tax=Noviherbaspirillum sp. Root189 TaxID=1736487 RepID=UPI0012E39AB6|nr:mechanosensitive ion channel domain-containing protein [Noviherbaspirillum sp. Root189]
MIIILLLRRMRQSGRLGPSIGTIIICIIVMLTLSGMPAVLSAQTPAKALAPPPVSAAPKPEEAPPAPQPIAISDIAPQAETALAAVRQLENRSRVEDAIQTATDRLPALEREIAYRLLEARRINRSAFSLESIRSLEEELRDVELRTVPVRRELTRSATQLDRDLKELEKLEGIWSITATAATEGAAPPDILDRARDLNRAIARTKKNVLDDRARLLALLGRVTDVGTQLGDVRRLLTDASERAVTRLLYQDSPPLWDTSFWGYSLSSFSSEARQNIVHQTYALTDYVRSYSRDFIFHAAFLAGLIMLFLLSRQRIDSLCEHDEGLKRNRTLFDMPIVTAALLSMLFSTWFYPRAPRSLWLMIGVVAAVPLLLFARKMVEKRIYEVLCSVVVFYLVDRLRALFSPLPGIHRVLLLIETLGILIFLLSAYRRRQHIASATDTLAPGKGLASHVIGYATFLALFMSATVLFCNFAGYARLADLVMRTMLASAYTGAVLYVMARAGEGLLHALLYIPPFSFLAGVRRHRATIAARVNKWMQWLAFLFWAILTLQGTGLLQLVTDWIQSLWKASLEIGNINAKVDDIAIFLFILWTTYVLSRLSRFFLEEEIFSRVRLDRGLPYAVSTTVHYIILLTGFVVALTAIGVDMTKFTIVAGALTVGIGFGLQNIVNNFVSGLIVLFERPVKVGDTIQIDDMVGRVQHIGIRATIVHSTTGASVIIPNGKLISDKVTNWTLSSQLRQLAVPVFTKPDINVARLKTTLLDVSRWNKQVLETPAPEVLFIKRGVDAFEFELRVWTNDLDAWLKVRSDLITDINEALSNEELPAQASSPVTLPTPPDDTAPG